ncbi:MAG: ferritin-like domain-containing protein [Labilithrix sp.]|nr:ferritin-like domain-containing protein [Labilithrix sp.]
MIKNDAAIGLNRTGIELHPTQKRELLEDVARAEPTSEGDETAIEDVRAEYTQASGPIGTVPPPANVRGAAKAVFDVAKGANVAVLLDKLGERLAFERTGTRLYEGLIAKHDVSGPLAYGPTRAELVEIHDQELQHFDLLRRAVISLGGDPTAVTPSADITAIASAGLLQIVVDPRTTMLQALHAALVVELVDNDGWSVLSELSLVAGHDELARKFQQPIVEEHDHLTKVRGWVRTSTLALKTPLGAAFERVKAKVAHGGSRAKR